mgnify:CR=1 FL=1
MAVVTNPQAGRVRRTVARLAPCTVLALAALLSACGTRQPGTAGGGHGYGAGDGDYRRDGPHDTPPPNLHAVPDAVPRIEPLAVGPNRPYTVMGKRYVPDVSNRPYKVRGIASWYGRQFHGRPTSNGEIYDMYAMTAAHPTLPIPSYARVTNPRNGRTVIVRINDRGPFIDGRVIDLSYVAAYKLGTLQHGTAEVIVERILPDEIRRGVPAPDPVMIASGDASGTAGEPARDADQLEALIARASSLPAPPDDDFERTAPGTSGFSEISFDTSRSGMVRASASPASSATATLLSATVPSASTAAVTTTATTSTSTGRIYPATPKPVIWSSDGAGPPVARAPSSPTTGSDAIAQLVSLRSVVQPASPSAYPAASTTIAPPSSLAGGATGALVEGNPMSTPAVSSQAQRADSGNGSGVFLQLGAFGQSANAHALAERLRRQIAHAGTPAVVNRGDHLYRVQLGPFADPEVALAMMEIIYTQTGIRPHIVRADNP